MCSENLFVQTKRVLRTCVIPFFPRASCSLRSRVPLPRSHADSLATPPSRRKASVHSELAPSWPLRHRGGGPQPTQNWPRPGHPAIAEEGLSPLRTGSVLATPPSRRRASTHSELAPSWPHRHRGGMPQSTQNWPPASLLSRCHCHASWCHWPLPQEGCQVQEGCPQASQCSGSSMPPVLAGFPCDGRTPVMN